jgi:manganese-dependent inorganic pyrophosphatase
MVSGWKKTSGLVHVRSAVRIFTACSGFFRHGSLEEAVRSDFKQFTAGRTDRIGQVEVVGFDDFSREGGNCGQPTRIKKEDALALAHYGDGHLFQTTLFLVEGRTNWPISWAIPCVNRTTY